MQKTETAGATDGAGAKVWCWGCNLRCWGCSPVAPALATGLTIYAYTCSLPICNAKSAYNRQSMIESGDAMSTRDLNVSVRTV